MKNLLLIPLTLVIIIVSGCGSVTGITPTEPHTLSELAGYDKVIVQDFCNNANAKDPNRVELACRNFPDRIAHQITVTKAFADVNRVQSPGKALALAGTITRYEEGDAFMRLMVGCGAGSSYLDADIVFKDNVSGDQIATLKVDKNSWVLGGGIASGQTVEAFMDEAAKRLAEELAGIKNPTQKK